MKLSKCCCCIELRLGCMIIAVLGFIASCAFFAAISPWDDRDYLVVPGNVLGILGNLCLLFGAYNSHKTAVALYLIAEGTQIACYFGFAIWMFTYGVVGLAFGVPILLYSCAWIYLWLCVFSFFQRIGGKVDVPKV